MGFCCITNYPQNEHLEHHLTFSQYLYKAMQCFWSGPISLISVVGWWLSLASLTCLSVGCCYFCDEDGLAKCLSSSRTGIWTRLTDLGIDAGLPVTAKKRKFYWSFFSNPHQNDIYYCLFSKRVSWTLTLDGKCCQVMLQKGQHTGLRRLGY